MAGAPARGGVPDSARDLASRPLGSHAPTGIPTISCGSTIGAPREWTGRYVHEAVTVRGTAGQLRGELQHYAYRDIADHLETIDRYTTLRRAPDARGRAGAPACCSSPAIRRWRSCATTSRTAASATACPASSSRR